MPYNGLSILSKIIIPAIVITAIIGIFAAVNQAGGRELLGAIKPAQSMTCVDCRSTDNDIWIELN